MAVQDQADRRVERVAANLLLRQRRSANRKEKWRGQRRASVTLHGTLFTKAKSRRRKPAAEVRIGGARAALESGRSGLEPTPARARRAAPPRARGLGARSRERAR